jgi:hypothetical protein
MPHVYVGMNGRDVEHREINPSIPTQSMCMFEKRNNRVNSSSMHIDVPNHSHVPGF